MKNKMGNHDFVFDKIKFKFKISFKILSKHRLGESLLVFVWALVCVHYLF